MYGYGGMGHYDIHTEVIMREQWLRFFSKEQMIRVQEVIRANGMDGLYSEFGLLFIEPSAEASAEPIVDEATRKMTAAFRRSESTPWGFGGVHSCICGAASEAHDYFLPGGWITNSLCIHYLAYHRDAVPETELQKVMHLGSGMRFPRPRELKRASPQEFKNRAIDAIRSLEHFG